MIEQDRMHRDPIAHLDFLFMNGPEVSLSPERELYVLAASGEVDIHEVRRVEDDECAAQVYTLPGEKPILGFNQYCVRTLTRDDATERLAELEAIKAGQSLLSIVESSE